MKLDKYNIIARIFPAIICISPVFTFAWFFLSPEIVNFFEKVYALKLVTNISISAIFIFLLAQFDRVVAKEVFERKYFENDLFLPTTNLLLHADSTLSAQFKEKIYNKISHDFRIILCTEKEENNDQMTARKRITEAVVLIRKKVGKGTLLFQHNIEYGFFRNLVGGSAVASLISLINIGFFWIINFNILALEISLLTLFLYLMPIVFSKKLICSSGKYYAKILIQEYMSV